MFSTSDWISANKIVLKSNGKFFEFWCTALLTDVVDEVCRVFTKVSQEFQLKMSRNYSEDQKNELEALESIYYNELEGIVVGNSIVK